MAASIALHAMGAAIAWVVPVGVDEWVADFRFQSGAGGEMTLQLPGRIPPSPEPSTTVAERFPDAKPLHSEQMSPQIVMNTPEAQAETSVLPTAHSPDVARPVSNALHEAVRLPADRNLVRGPILSMPTFSSSTANAEEVLHQEGADRQDGHGAPGASLVDADSLNGHIPAPRYPRASRLRGEEGTVVLEFTVLPDGTITDVVATKPGEYPLLTAAATEAIQAARMRPLGRSIRAFRRFIFTLQ